jgi:hypothetical protein
LKKSLIKTTSFRGGFDGSFQVKLLYSGFSLILAYFSDFTGVYSLIFARRKNITNAIEKRLNSHNFFLATG